MQAEDLRKCKEALGDTIPDLKKLNEALRLATEHGFPKVARKVLARGHCDILGEEFEEVDAIISSDGDLER